ncbi:MAG TPA: S8 family serine peptidase [Tepidisphaeraceae bacterium]
MIEPLEARKVLSANGFGAAGAQIRFEAAATAFPSATGAGQTVAVIDSGIDYTHPALGGGFGPGFKVVGGYDFADDDSDPIDDVFGHGTEVAGIIAASPAGGSSYQGIAPDAKLVALRVDGSDGTDSVPDARIEEALKWVIDHREEFGITVVNISYGTGSYNEPTVSTVYGDEIVALRDAGVTLVAAAGNGGLTSNQGINTPAADPSVVSVGAVGLNNRVAGQSRRGPALALLAPGEEVQTTLLGGSYGLVEGTSFSAPVVSGAVVLMRNIDPTLTPADTLSILRASGVATFDGGARTGNYSFLTYPRLDLLNALNLTRARKPGNTAQQLSLGQFGNQSSLAVDAQGVTHFAYYDARAGTMKYATRSVAGQWSPTQTIDNTLPYMGYYLSLAVDPQGQPAVAYFDGTNGDLEYARYDGTAWQRTTIDAKNSTGAYPSLVFDRNGNALVTYYRKTSGDLRAARRDFNGNWTITSIATAGDVGRYSSAAVDAKGRVGVAYEDSTHGWVGYSQMDPRRNTWSNTIIDKSTRGVAYVSTAFSTDNNQPWISYYDAHPANLKVANFSGRRWTTKTVASRGATGLFSTLYFGGADQPSVLYYDKRQNALLVAESDAGTWSLERLHGSAGRFASGVVDNTAGVFRYAYYNGSGVSIAERNL